jgi:AraC family transcriptional regulator, regulatory protein of adaptative response / DNA-3-methyladenine glycosylase II
LALIAEGALDGEGNTVEKLADRLGLGERQLRRLFLQHLGASPISVAQTRRVLFAKQLIHETQMPMTEVAMAAGFGSLRRFNETFRELFDRPPSALRRKNAARHAEKDVSLRLRYRAPYDWESMLGFLQARAIPGVEVVENGRYLRTVEVDGAMGSIEVSHLPDRQSLGVSIRFPDVRLFPAIVARVRRQFVWARTSRRLTIIYPAILCWHDWWRSVRACARRADEMDSRSRYALCLASRSA